VRELPTGTVTFLFSDIEGSTRLLNELGSEQYSEALAEHRRRMRAAFAAHGGVEVDTQGDAFFVAFPEARAALAAADEAQRELAQGPVRVRMGIHTGKPLATPEGYVGMDVHRGARVMSAGHGGQVLVSEETYTQVDGDTGLTDLGLHRLKDLTEPQRLWQLGEREFPPLKTLYQTNLPVQPTPLVGRESELAEVLGLIQDSRLVTFTGPGGSGKTRLALQAAAELVDEFKDGVWWVSLAALRDPELVEPAIAQVVGAKDGLAEHLRGRQTLLLLDNFEQLLEAAPRLSALLAEAPELRLLATSRERLALSAEQEYAVPTMVPVEAVALFTARARQLEPDFEPNDAVEEICRRLDGLPLAVELAAARIKVLTPEQILERLGRSLELLTAGARDAPARHQTLQATIEWSYELLDEEEKQLFARLGVFGGSFDLEAAEAVCDSDLDTLAALVDKSLLRRAEGGRFFLLETIREYALERLDERRETEVVQRRHASYFLAFVEALESLFLGPEEQLALDRLTAEHENLRAALRFSIDSGNADTALRLATGGVQRYWRIRGDLAEGRRWLEEALGEGGVDALLRAKGLRAVANIAGVQGDSEVVIDAAGEALSSFRERGDVPNTIDCLNALGAATMRNGDLPTARRYFEEVEQLALASHDAFRLEAAVGNLGNIALYEGDYERAQLLFQRSLELARELNLQEAIAHALLNSGLAALQLADYGRAEALFREALEVAADIDSLATVVYGCEGLGAALALEAKSEHAVELLAGARRIGDSMGLELEPFEQRMHDRAIELARSDLTEAEFDAAWAAGQEMTKDELISHAVAVID
jgi:predicted ATPase